METYIDRIKKKKSEKRLTNEQLAERSGIPLGTLSKVLAGMSDSPKLSTVIAICNALDCSVEYIATGTPENTNNYTLTQEEIAFVEAWRELDRWGRETTEAVMAKETERVQASRETEETEEAAPSEKRAARILRPLSTAGRYAGEATKGKRSLSLFDLPVSAGVGVYLDESTAETITVPVMEKTEEADYALRISGNSMEPKYHNGDVLLVQSTDTVEVGEAGIFFLDGSGFFKIFAGDRLLSLNPEYGPILLRDFSDVQCKGRVVGKLRRK